MGPAITLLSTRCSTWPTCLHIPLLKILNKCNGLSKITLWWIHIISFQWRKHLYCNTEGCKNIAAHHFVQHLKYYNAPWSSYLVMLSIFLYLDDLFAHIGASIWWSFLSASRRSGFVEAIHLTKSRLMVPRTSKDASQLWFIKLLWQAFFAIKTHKVLYNKTSFLCQKGTEPFLS